MINAADNKKLGHKATTENYTSGEKKKIFDKMIHEQTKKLLRGSPEVAVQKSLSLTTNLITKYPVSFFFFFFLLLKIKIRMRITIFQIFSYKSFCRFCFELKFTLFLKCLRTIVFTDFKN